MTGYGILDHRSEQIMQAIKSAGRPVKASVIAKDIGKTWQHVMKWIEWRLYPRWVKIVDQGEKNPSGYRPKLYALTPLGLAKLEAEPKGEKQ